MSKVIMLLVDDLHLEHRSTEMKIQFANVLNEKIEHIKKQGNTPILLCAGDIDEGTAGIEWVQQFKCDIIYTCGNHEFWNNDYYSLIESIQERVKEPAFKHINFLYNSSVIIQNIRFLGGSLWTEMGKSWPWWGNNKVIENFSLMADFRKIKAESFYDNLADVKILIELLENNLVTRDKIDELIDKKLFNPLIQLRENRKTCSYIKSELSNKFEGKTVVMTHHLPIEDLWVKRVGMDKSILRAESINDKDLYLDIDKKMPRSKNVLMMGFYVNDYKDDFIERSFSPDLWVHGHFHQSVDAYFGRTRIVSSPVGHFKAEMEHQDIKVKELVLDKDGSKTMIQKFMKERFEELNLNDFEKIINDFKTAVFSYNIAVNNGILSSVDFEPVLRVFNESMRSRINIMKEEIAELLNSYIIINNLNNGISFHKEYYIVSRLSGLHQWTKNNGDVFCPVLKEFIVNEKSFDSDVVMNEENYLCLSKNWIEIIDLLLDDLSKFKKGLLEFAENLV